MALLTPRLGVAFQRTTGAQEGQAPAAQNPSSPVGVRDGWDDRKANGPNLTGTAEGAPLSKPASAGQMLQDLVTGPPGAQSEADQAFGEEATPALQNLFTQLPRDDRNVLAGVAYNTRQSQNVSMQQMVEEDKGFDQTAWNGMSPLEQAQRFGVAVANRTLRTEPPSAAERLYVRSDTAPEVVQTQFPEKAAIWKTYNEGSRVTVMRQAQHQALVRDTTFEKDWERVAIAVSHPDEIHPAAKQIGELQSAIDTVRKVTDSTGPELFRSLELSHANVAQAPLSPEEDVLQQAKTLLTLDKEGDLPDAKQSGSFTTTRREAIAALQKATDTAEKALKSDPDTQILAAVRNQGGLLVADRAGEVAGLRKAIQAASKDPSWANASDVDRAHLLQAAYIQHEARGALAIRMPPPTPASPNNTDKALVKDLVDTNQFVQTVGNQIRYRPAQIAA